MITLFGATGFTGRLVAEELGTLSLPPGNIRLAGRSMEKLEQLAGTLPYEAELVTADPNKPATLPVLFKDTQVLINCVGPFTDLGNPVVAMAALHGTHYVDTTNELGFVHRMRSYHQMARNNQAAIVPACGFEVALADCAAALLSETNNTPSTSIDITYALSGGNSSRGTRHSAIRSLGTSWLAYQNGEWVKAVPCSRTRWVSLPLGQRAAISFPSSEISTLPLHLQTGEINTWLVISRGARHWAKIILPFFSWLARSPLTGLIVMLSSVLVRPPNPGLRQKDAWLLQVEVASPTGTKSLTFTGKGVYEITAKIAVLTASKLLAPELDKFGVLPPSAVLQPKEFLNHVVDRWGCEVLVSPPEIKLGGQ